MIHDLTLFTGKDYPGGIEAVKVEIRKVHAFHILHVNSRIDKFNGVSGLTYLIEFPN